VKPLDRELLSQLVRDGARIVTVEENALAGGFGSAVMEALEEMGISARVKRIGIPDRFVPHATQQEQRKELGLDEESLGAAFQEWFAPAKGTVVPLSLGAVRSAS
jgi:1-deoxy-D-xylulose-5-phosphate synthase